MQRSSRRTLVALGVSLALHAALLAWVASRPPPPPPPPANLPVQLVFIEPRPAPAPSPPAPAPKPPSKPPRQAPGPKSSARPPPAQPPPPPVATVPGTGAPSGTAVPSDAPRADGLGRFPGQSPPGPQVDDYSLLSKLPSVSVPDPRGGLVSDPKAVVDSTVREAVGVQRAAGSVPAYFHDLRVALTAAWDVDRIMKHKEREGRSLRRNRTVIRLVQNRAGHLLQMGVLFTSPDPELDTGAILDLQRVARSLPVPTPDALGSREQLVTVWQFEFIPPPRPQVSTSGSFDLMNLVDKHAIPPPSIKILTLLSYE